MSQSSDVDALLLRFMEAEGERRVPTTHPRGPPALTPLTKTTAVTASLARALPCIDPPPPPHGDACMCSVATSAVCRAERQSTASNGSSSSGDTQAEAATPSRRPSRHSTSAVSNSGGLQVKTNAEDTSSQGDLAPRADPASSPTPPLSLSHPVVEFLAGVQLQGYAPRLLHELRICSVAELAARGDSSANVAGLLGYGASLQQQGELWRGLRRWERDEARRAKAAVAESRRLAQEAERSARRQAKELRTAASTAAGAGAKRKRPTAVTSTSDTAGPRPSATHATDVGGRQSTLLFTALGSCVGTQDGASFRVADLAAEEPCSPHLVSSDSGTVVAAVSSASVGVASSASCPSLTVSATQLMRQLSYRCAHSRQAARQRHGVTGGGGPREGGVGAPAVTDSPAPASAAPYDVDAEEVEVEEESDGDRVAVAEADEADGTAARRSDDSSNDAVAGARAAPTAASAEALSDAGSLPNCAQHESHDDAALMPSQPPAALSPSCASSASHLSSVLCSLRAADAPVVVHEAPADASVVPTNSATPGLANPVCTHAATGVAHNGLVAMQNISLSALSAAAELNPLTPLLQLPGGERDQCDEEGQQEVYTQVTATAEADIPETRSTLGQHGVGCPGGEGWMETVASRPIDAAGLAESPPRLPESKQSNSPELASTHVTSVSVAGAAELVGRAEQRRAAARHRLQETLEAALRRYNAEVRGSPGATPAPLHDGPAVRVVVHPLSTPRVGHGAPLVWWAASAAGSPTPARREVGTLCDLECDSAVAARPKDADVEAVTCAAGVRNGNALALRTSAEVVLSALTSTDVSARTTGRVTAAPGPASHGTRATLPPLPTTSQETTSGTTTAARAAAPASPAPAPLVCAEVERDDEDCESVGRLTAGTQRLPASPLGRYSTEAGDIAAAAAAAAADAAAPAVLWVAQEEGVEDESDDTASTEADRFIADPSAAASPLLRTGSPHSNRRNCSPDVAAEERWWAAYGIDALEYTQNGDFAAEPQARSASPGGDSEATSLGRLRQPTASPPPRVVVELSSSRTEDEEEDSGRASQPQEASLAGSGAALRVGLNGDSVSALSAALGREADDALATREFHVHLDPAAWPRMSNAELRRLCEEVGLRTASSAGLASPAPVAESRRGHSAPLPAAPPRNATTPPRSVSPAWDTFGLPLHTSRELFHWPSSDVHDAAAATGATPQRATTQPEQKRAHGEEAVGEDARAPQHQKQQDSLPASAAAAVERESMLEALRLLAARLRFRRAVAPLFLHRVSRLSRLPYKRVRAAELLDEGSLLTRDDLQQARQRVKAEEQAEADRCIVAALAAQAAESVERGAQLAASRWTGGAAAGAASSALAREELSVYERILLREPVLVEAAVAAVQSAFPHISHTRVQQLLTANDVIAEVAGTTSTKGSTTPSRSPSQPPRSRSPSAPSPEDGLSAERSADGASTGGGDATPLSQEARQRANARRYFSQRAYTTRRGLGWSRGRGRGRGP